MSGTQRLVRLAAEHAAVKKREREEAVALRSQRTREDLADQQLQRSEARKVPAAELDAEYVAGSSPGVASLPRRPPPALPREQQLSTAAAWAALSLVLGWYLLRFRRALFVRAACISTPTC